MVLICLTVSFQSEDVMEYLGLSYGQHKQGKVCSVGLVPARWGFCPTMVGAKSI